jgi:hypothetical protein
VAQLFSLGIIDVYMKNAISIGIMAFSALLTGCGNKNSSSDSSAISPSDVQIRQKVVGTWKLDSDPTNSLTFNSDGSASFTSAGGFGTWKVTNGVFICIENGPEGDNETGKVVRIDDHEWFLQEVGTSNVMRLHKQ